MKNLNNNCFQEYEWSDLYSLMQTPNAPVGPVLQPLNIKRIMFKYTHISSIDYRRSALYKKFDGSEEIVDLLKLELKKMDTSITRVEENKEDNSLTLYYDDGRIDKVIQIINNSNILPTFIYSPIKRINTGENEETRYYANGSIDRLISIRS